MLLSLLDNHQTKNIMMKKTTLICAATLSSVCTYAADTVTTIDPTAFVKDTETSKGIATLSEIFAQTATEWSIETTFTYKSDTAMNTWGTTILSTAESLTEASYKGGFQLWVGTAGNLMAKGCGFETYGDKGAVYGTPLGSTLTKDSSYTVVLDVVYNETAKNYTTSLTLKGSDGVQIGNKATSTYTFQESDVISHLYTACGQGSATTWSAPKVTLKTSGALVPEPATATLSLLALAGLAARRRRH